MKLQDLSRLYIPALFVIGLGLILAYAPGISTKPPFTFSAGEIITVSGLAIFIIAWIGESKRVLIKKQYVAKQMTLPTYPKIIEFMSSPARRIAEAIFFPALILFVVSVVFIGPGPIGSVLEGLGGVGVVLGTGLFIHRFFFS